MPTNLELKAAISSLPQAKKCAQALGARNIGTLNQIDTYFKVRTGRLKLREIDGKRAEIIFYRRANSKNSRYSKYSVIEVDDPLQVKEVFRTLFGISEVVRKRRLLFLFQNARIHIDSVQKLGSFIEFEVIVRHGKKQARSLMSLLRRQFAIDSHSVIGGSYSDLIRQRKK